MVCVTVAGHIFPQHLNTSVQACGMASILQPRCTLSSFRNTCIHRVLNPLLVLKCVRCAFERRCWRISRSTILPGVRRGVIWVQQRGKVWTVKHFTFLEAECFSLSWERGGSPSPWNLGICWQLAPLRPQSSGKWEFDPWKMYCFR